jgi:hypothetical protein
MALKKPLVIYSGDISEIQVGDTLDANFEGVSCKNEDLVNPIPKGTLVNVYNGIGGILSCKLADSTAGADQFLCDGVTMENIAAGGTHYGLVRMDGIADDVSGVSVKGTIYYLGAAGACTDTPPTGSGDVVQRLGKAVSSSQLQLQIQLPIYLQ